MKISKEEKEQVRLVNKNRELHHKELLKEEKKSHQKSKVAPSDDIIILKNVNKIYPNHVQAVYNFDLSIKEKEVYDLKHELILSDAKAQTSTDELENALEKIKELEKEIIRLQSR